VSPWLRPLREALDAAPEPVTFFFRDDDAGWRDDRLMALLDVFAERAVPIDLAAIPLDMTPQLADALLARAERQPLGLHQHGYAHTSHETEGRKCEFGPARSADAQLHDIGDGRRRLLELLGPALQPIFTPPWNRCTADTGHAIVALGFYVLSRESRAQPLGIGGLDEIPIHVDWVKPDAITRLAGAIADGGRTGVMFHHAEMDADELARADELLALLARDERVRAAPILG
jgi:hypothetical protein